MKVRVRLFAYLSDLVGKRGAFEIDLEEGATVSMLLDRLLLESSTKNVLFGENREVKSNITILRNGREIRFSEGLETPLSSGDEVAFFPVVAGG